MRVIYLNKVRIEENLPAVNFTLFNAYALSQAGADCLLFLQSSIKDYELQTLYTNFHLEVLKNFQVNIIPQKRYFGIRTNQWFYFCVYNEIRRIHKKVVIDAVISRDPGALPYLSRLKNKHSIPVFYQPHNFYLDLKIRPDINPKNAFKYHLLEKRFLPEMSGILCLQDSQAALYKRYLPQQNIQVTSPGLIQTKLENNNRFNNKLIGYIGSLQLKKGMDVLLKAFKGLKDYNYKLLLIGGRNQAELEPVANLVQQMCLSQSVEITGWLPYRQMEEYLDSISVGVIPLRDAFYNRYLTAPNKLFDYISRGIPVVASDLDAIRNFITPGKEGELVAPNQPELLLKAILHISKDETRYEQYRQNAIQSAKKFIWKDQAQMMLRIIQEAPKD